MNSAASSPSLVHRAYSRVRQLWLVWSAAAVLVAAALNGAGRLGWLHRGQLYSAVPALASAAFLVLWFRRARALTRARFARELDTRWQLRSRLESAEELTAHDSALAQAQRAEAAQSVASRGEIGFAGWLSAISIALLCLTLLLTEAATYAFRAWRIAAAENAMTKPETIPASLAWTGPDEPIQATPIDEVSLSASAESPHGFQKLSLEVSVNGEPQPSQPVDPATADDAARPGAQQLPFSLPLDALDAEPGDIISYHLTGEPIGAPPGTIVKSPPRFIEVRPPGRGPGGDQPGPNDGPAKQENPDATEMMRRVFALRTAQIRLIEINSMLSKLTEGQTNPVWIEENTRAVAEQKDLAIKSADARDFATRKSLPALLATNLGAAMAPMREAANKMEASDNTDALARQQRALNLILEAAKVFKTKKKRGNSAPPPALIADPFRDIEILNLPPRRETPAGQLEELANRQRIAVELLTASPVHPTNPNSASAAEATIIRDAGKLSAVSKLEPSAVALLRNAAASADNTARQLDANDPTAAREPAAAALDAFEKAVEAQDRIGREIAVAELDRIRRSLNPASRETGTGERGGLLRRAYEDLYAAANQQQRTGSSEAARQLANLAERLSAPTVPGTTSVPNSNARAQEAAIAAARAQISLAPRIAALNRAVRQLNRAKAASPFSPEIAAHLEIGSQEAEWLAADDPTRELAREVSNTMGTAQSGTQPANVADSLAAVVRLAAALESARNSTQRDEIVRRFNADEIDPSYRQAVETYFEKLSRDGAKAAGVAPVPSAAP